VEPTPDDGSDTGRDSGSGEGTEDAIDRPKPQGGGAMTAKPDPVLSRNA
jgi:hypothetical protein